MSFEASAGYAADLLADVLGTKVYLVKNSVNADGPETLLSIPPVPPATWVRLRGAWGSGRAPETATGVMGAGDRVPGAQPLARTFTVRAKCLAVAPTIDDKLVVEADGTTWAVTYVDPIYAVSSVVAYRLFTRQLGRA